MGATTPAAARGRRLQIAALGAVLLIAGGVRIAALVEIRSIGFFHQPMSDAHIYVQRAREIAGGDWLGPASFVHAPLYAYFLALVGGPSGDYVWAPRIAAILLGVVAVALTYGIARRCFGTTAGLLAAGMLALYPPAIFYDLLIQKAGLTLLLSTFVIWAAVRAASRPNWRTWGLAGAALGLLILNRQNAAVDWLLLAAWAWLARGDATDGTARARPLRTRLTAIAALSVACAAVLTPWVVRNRIVLGEWVLTTPNLGQNLMMGNMTGATGTYIPARRGQGTAEREQAAWTRDAEQALGRKLSARAVSDYYRQAALSWIRAHPGDWLRITLRKLALTWGAYELPDTEDYYLYQERAVVLRGLDAVWHFGVLAPLAVAGIALTARRWRQLWPLHAWLAVTSVSVAVFVVFGRYRLPLLPALLPFAAAAVSEIATRLVARRFRGLAPAVASAAIMALAANWPWHAARAPQSTSYLNHAVALADAGRRDEALSELRRALALDPDGVDVHQALGSVYFDLRQYEAALREYTLARDGDPAYGPAWRGMGDALAAQDRLDAALPCFRKAYELDPADPRTANCLASALARLGQFDEALQIFNRLLENSPRFAEGYLNLANTYLAMSRIDDAAAAYDRAIALQPNYADALFNRGLLELGRGRGGAAAEFLKRAMAARPNDDAVRGALLKALLMDRRRPEAIELVDQWLREHPDRKDLRALRASLDAPQ